MTTTTMHDEFCEKNKDCSSCNQTQQPIAYAMAGKLGVWSFDRLYARNARH
jgi:hypothetical protein